MSKTSINREVALAGQRVRRKVIFALVLCSVIPLLLLTYAFHAPVREVLGPLFGLASSVSIPAILTFTALLMAGGAFIVWDIATALSRAAQLSNEQSPELPAEPSRKDEIGTLMSSFARMLATIEQQSQEINEFPRRLDQLTREAFRDSLTGLPNRALFMDRLTHALTRAERSGTNLAVLFLDLDRFKILNDTLGQEVGDQLLVEVGHRLAACLSPEDTVARLGGDEFALLLEDASDLNGATALAERVSAEIQRPFVVEGRDVLISASIGVALTGGGSMQPEEVLHNADLAMYQAKAEGRARYELYEPGLNVSTRERLDLQADLRTAGARRGLPMECLSQIKTGNGRVPILSSGNPRGFPNGSYADREAASQARRVRERPVLPHPGAAERAVRPVPRPGRGRSRRCRARSRPAQQRHLGHGEMAGREDPRARSR